MSPETVAFTVGWAGGLLTMAAMMLGRRKIVIALVIGIPILSVTLEQMAR